MLSLTALLNSFCIPASWIEPTLRFQFVMMMLYGDSDKKSDVYSMLWALVFGFATLNILGLVAKRFEPERSRLNFGESLAITVVVVSVALLGWELLYFFKILPIKLNP